MLIKQIKKKYNVDAQRIEQMVWMLFLKVYDAKEDYMKDWDIKFSKRKQEPRNCNLYIWKNDKKF